MKKKVAMAVMVGLAIGMAGISPFLPGMVKDPWEKERLIPISVQPEGIKCYKWQTREWYFPVWMNNGLWCEVDQRPR